MAAREDHLTGPRRGSVGIGLEPPDCHGTLAISLSAASIALLSLDGICENKGGQIRGSSSRRLRCCAAAVVIVENAMEDSRFRTSPYCAGEPYIRFYAGAPLVGSGDGCLRPYWASQGVRTDCLLVLASSDCSAPAPGVLHCLNIHVSPPPPSSLV